VSARIYLEGGGDGKDLKMRCQKGFHNLLKKQTQLEGRLPHLVACGGRERVYDRFKISHSQSGSDEYVAMLIDSEEPVKDIEKTWSHLKERDGWKRPKGAKDDQVLFMTTCMETWIITDRDALRSHYRSDCLQLSSLPALDNIENRSRHDVQGGLENATRNCVNTYKKGKRSFEILGKLAPDTLRQYLPSFVRVCEVLNRKLLKQ